MLLARFRGVLLVLVACLAVVVPSAVAVVSVEGQQASSATTTSVLSSHLSRGPSISTSSRSGGLGHVDAGASAEGTHPASQLTRFAAEDATVLSKVDRVGSALKDDPFHRSVSWVVDDPNARKFVFQGGDGVQRTLYQLLGEMNGKPGVFEWILDESGSKPVIVHQRFIPGGSITGYPNQVP